MSYKRQNLLRLGEHLGSPTGFVWGPCCSTFLIFCVVFLCVFILCLVCPLLPVSVLARYWLPLRFYLTFIIVMLIQIGILWMLHHLAHGRWFSPGTPASSITKTGRHNIAEILLKMALNTKNQIKSNLTGIWVYVLFTLIIGISSWVFLSIGIMIFALSHLIGSLLFVVGLSVTIVIFSSFYLLDILHLILSCLWS